MAARPNIGGDAARDREPSGLSAPRTVPVLVNLPTEAEHLQEIGAVDSSVLVLAAYEPGSGGAPDDDKPDQGKLDEMLGQAEVLFTFRFPVDWVERAPNLKWVQLASAGSDTVLREGLLDRRPDLLLTTSSGVHEVPISEHILAMILYFSRGFHIATRNQARHKWERYRPDEASGKTVCLVGYGPIARRAATLCKGLGMRVVAVRASIAEQQAGFEAVERFYPLEDLNTLLAESDYVVLAAPRTPRSERMIGREQLKAMKSTAVLVNISRGALVDEPALIEALRDGEIAGAALDVFAQEPLPESSPLWDMPNVLVTPHVSGGNPHYMRRVTDLFCDNLRRYLSGEPLRNLVDKERGY
jgi:phosphoglycerate dehydrogenase-like enzyme